MSYDLLVDIVQWALRIATFGLIAVVAWKMFAGRLSLRELLAGRKHGKAEPERLLALATAVALLAIYLIHCVNALKDVAVPRALPDVAPWMVAVVAASQALYLGGKLLRA